MSRDFRLFLEDILESCEKVLRYTHGLSFEQFRADEKTVDAVVRNLEIVGEAIRHLPSELREQHPEVEWRRITGLRNIVAHEYFGVDEDILWDVVQNKIPRLLEQIQLILTTRSPGDEQL